MTTLFLRRRKLNQNEVYKEEEIEDRGKKSVLSFNATALHKNNSTTRRSNDRAQFVQRDELSSSATPGGDAHPI